MERQFNIYCNDEKGVVVAVTYYHNRCIRGIARCNPKDTFDREKGIELAQARCEAKLSKMQIEEAGGTIAYLNFIKEMLEDELCKATEFQSFACENLTSAEEVIAKYKSENQDVSG